MGISRYKHDNLSSYTLGMTITMELILYKPEITERVYISSSVDENKNMEQLRKLCAKHNIAIEQSDKVFNILSPKGNCFVIGAFKKFSSTLSDEAHIVLVNPADSGNLGNIIRTAIGFGIKNIAIITPAVDIFDPKTVRASMGALFHVNYECFNSIDAYRQKFPRQNLYAFMLGASQPLHSASFIEPYSLIFGNEAKGLPAEYAKFCQAIVIPHTKEIDSLNLNIAASIAMYAATISKWK